MHRRAKIFLHYQSIIFFQTPIFKYVAPTLHIEVVSDITPTHVV